MNKADLYDLADAFYAAWNAHDPRAICALYADDVVFTSPFITKMGLSDDGVITGIQAFFNYVQTALPRVPNLKFEPMANCFGVTGNTLVYRNQSGHTVTEVHEHNEDGLIRSATVAYSGAPLKRPAALKR